MPLPATTHNTLVNQINALKLSASVDDFTLRRLDHEARNLLKNSPWEGWFILGAVALLRKDVDEMRRCMNRALQCAPDRAAMQTNYAVALREAGLFAEAADMAAAAFLANRCAETLEHAMATALFTGRVSQAEGFLNQADQAHIAVEPYCRDWLRAALEVTRARRIHEDDLIALHGIVETVFQSFEDRRFIGRNISHTFHALQEEETIWLYNGVMLPTHDDSDVETVVDLNERLVEVLAVAEINTAVLEACVVEFVAMEQEAEDT